MLKIGIWTSVLALLALWLGSCSQSGTMQTQKLPPSYFRIVDAVNSGSTYAYAPAIIVKDGTYHVFYCSKAMLIPTWDAIRYTTSTDSKTWSTPQIMVLPSWDNGMDMAACDPSLVYYQGFYYLYYSSAMTTAPNVFQTIVRVARSVNIDGPYLTYTQRGTWEPGPPDPQIIISPMQIHTTNPPGYGAGQTSVVVQNGKLLMWYTDDSLFVDGQPNLQTFMLESSDPVTWVPDTSCATDLVNQPSIDVKYDPSHSQFVMVKVENEFQSDAYLGFAVSADGMHWSSPQTVISPSEFPLYTHDAGMAGDETGNIVSLHTLVGFGAPYGLANVNNWGQWDLYGVFVNPP
jgi:hypothetical protein